jgi:hypothetical protein
MHPHVGGFPDGFERSILTARLALCMHSTATVSLCIPTQSQRVKLCPTDDPVLKKLILGRLIGCTRTQRSMAIVSNNPPRFKKPSAPI